MDSSSLLSTGAKFQVPGECRSLQRWEGLLLCWKAGLIPGKDVVETLAQP